MFKNALIIFSLLIGLFVPKNILSDSCPPHMVQVKDFCIDKYEAPNKMGEQPFVFFSPNEAQEWCSKRQKTLCSTQQWEAACLSTPKQNFYYSRKYSKEVCNTEANNPEVNRPLLYTVNNYKLDFTAKNFPRFLDIIWKADPNLGAYIWKIYNALPSGGKEYCTNSTGTFDMLGNVSEWTVLERTKKIVSKGGFWGKGASCRQRAFYPHSRVRDYHTGFRCCSETIKDPFKYLE